MKFNTNYISLGILLAAFFYSAFRFISFSASTSEAVDTGYKDVVITHWQLEPGFREAMDWAIDEYNALAHVKEANVKVRQLAITERVYNQFMNVHLISGTAPDMAEKGKTRLIQGNSIAKFYAPLTAYVNDPNPYNADEYLPGGIDPALKSELQDLPWSETFIDGMRGGYDEAMQDYYAIPISVWGGIRLFYNMKLVREAKVIILENIDNSPQPEWISTCWLRGEGVDARGYLTDSPRLREWLKSDEIPQTLGQLLLLCNAAKPLGEKMEMEHLVAISGSNYGPSNLADSYQRLFFDFNGEVNDSDYDQSVSATEVFAGYEKGNWTWQDEQIREFFQLSKEVALHFPKGFQGLDREQAQRRFVLGNSMMISSGGWDAGGIFSGVDGLREENQFEIRVGSAPVAGEGERWHKYISYAKSEASAGTGAPFAVNKASKHFDHALDFLKFITSYRINEEFNRRAAWLPAIVGAKPNERIAPFMPIIAGADTRNALNFGTGGLIRTTFTGQGKLVTSGELSYEEFATKMEEAFANKRHGIAAKWKDDHRRARERSRAIDSTLTVMRLKKRRHGEGRTAIIYQRLLQDSINQDEGVSIETLWNAVHPDKPWIGKEEGN